METFFCTSVNTSITLVAKLIFFCPNEIMGGDYSSIIELEIYIIRR